MRMWALVCGLALAACSRAPVLPQQGAHPTIVSLNPCSDQVITDLADRGQILAISAFSHDAASSSIDLAKARTFRAVSSALEEVLALRPDLVIADDFLSPSAEAAMKAQGIKVLRVPIAKRAEDSKNQVRMLAAAVGHMDRGERMVAQINQAMAQAKPPAQSTPISAIVWQSGGSVAGPDSLIGDLLRRTGFQQLSASRGMKQSDLLPLEMMLADPPQVIMIAGKSPSQENRLLSHPALSALKSTQQEPYDPSLLWCGGPTIIKAAAKLAEIRAKVAPLHKSASRAL